MAKKATKKEDKLNLESILFNCRDYLRSNAALNDKRDLLITLVFLRFIGEKFEDGLQKLRQDLIAQGLDPDDEEIFAAFFDDATFTDGTYNLPIEARWSTIINTPATQLNVALDTALHSLANSSTAEGRVVGQLEFHGVGFKSSEIERVMHQGNFCIAEIFAVQVAIAENVAEAAIALVAAEAFVVADGASDLPGLVIDTECSAGGNPDCAIERDAVFHHHIHDPGGEHAAHGAAFQYETFLHASCAAKYARKAVICKPF